MEDKIVALMNEFSANVDEVFIGKTPKWEDEKKDKMYNVDIYIFRHPGMGNSKQIIMAENTISIMTATESYLVNLLQSKICDEKLLRDTVEQAIKDWMELK